MHQLGLAGTDTSSCVGDAAQDLLVLSGKPPNTALSTVPYTHSLEHPNASRTRISSSIGTDDWPRLRSWDRVQVLGDLIAWSVPSDGRMCEVKVVNWKTGVTVWEFYDQPFHRCRLISEYHVVVVTFESLLVYAIDRERERQSPAARSTTGTALCVLQLPEWFRTIRNSCYLLVRSYIQFPPSLAAKDRPLYRYDPSLTLDIHYITPKNGSQLVQYAVFIPVATIAAHAELAARVQSESPPSAASASPPDGHISESPRKVVPWSEWPRRDARRAFRVEQPLRLGCLCAVTQQRRSAAGASGTSEFFLRVLVFHVHPWARPDPQRSTPLRDTEVGKRSVALLGRAFAQSIRTTFPFDVTRRDIPLGQDDRSPTVVLGEDGLVLVTAPD
ncbi:hypothetical protein GSI_03589 [Ganoderma sinense ZZ0214-1]|uniref:Uncharacterized protein n=1 Tax=Ganoderma sinense ZZ0214-1 TaxID=1077348 RepID=A0A2G8SJD4_9APHY|nr:hypothetical protein GSI_03589 [Ganoderma sinense ZZ0214-1]